MEEVLSAQICEPRGVEESDLSAGTLPTTEMPSATLRIASQGPEMLEEEVLFATAVDEAEQHSSTPQSQQDLSDLRSPNFSLFLQSRFGESFAAPYFRTHADALSFVQGYMQYCASYCMPVLTPIQLPFAIQCGDGFAPCGKNPFDPSSGTCRFVTHNNLIVGYVFDTTISNGPWKIPVNAGEMYYYDLGQNSLIRLR